MFYTPNEPLSSIFDSKGSPNILSKIWRNLHDVSYFKMFPHLAVWLQLSTPVNAAHTCADITLDMHPFCSLSCLAVSFWIFPHDIKYSSNNMFNYYAIYLLTMQRTLRLSVKFQASKFTLSSWLPVGSQSMGLLLLRFLQVFLGFNLGNG